MEKTPMLEPINGGVVCEVCAHLEKRLGADMKTRIPLCRRFPPLQVGGLVQGPDGPVVAVEARFPIISAPLEHWCGEFAPRYPH